MVSVWDNHRRTRRTLSAFFSTLMIFTLSFNTFAKAPEPAWGKYGVASTAHPLATNAAVEILEEGGNAIDAALAAIYTLGVVTGHSLGIGGGEFWVVRLADGTITTLDGREVAPAASARDMYLDSTGAVIPGLSTVGALAGGIPGSIAVRELARERYGTKARKRVMRSAISAADDGFLITPYQEMMFGYCVPYFQQFPSAANVMFKQDTTTWQAGDLFQQKDLARTLRRIAKNGTKDFYHGETAREMVRAIQEAGGIMTLEDLASYEVIERAPIHGEYRGYDVYSMPPPSSGGVHLIQMLHMLEEWNLPQFGRYSSQYYHHLAEVMEAAFADRSVYLGDPAFVNVPVEGLVSRDYAAQLRSRINNLWHTRVQSPGNPMMFMENPPDSLLKPSHTSHLSVMDQWGNVVSITSSVNTWFGSKMILGSTGIFLNNTMDDFSVQPGHPNAFGLVGNEANAVAPGKRPLSSMTPTIILKDGKPFMAVGAAGGPRIITATLQTILNVIDFGADMQEAISDPRIHHQWAPNVLYVDEEISPDCVQRLHEMGHNAFRRTLGCIVHGVLYDEESGLYFGGADPRALGTAAGVQTH